MSTLAISSRDNKTHFQPGEILEGTVSWQLDVGAQAIELRLIWFTSGKGDTDVSVEETRHFDSPPLAGSSAFRFALPLAPHSFSGQLISLSWALELVVMPGADAARWEFFIAPAGREIILPKGENPDLQKLPSWLKGKLQKQNNIAIQDDAFTSSTLNSANDATNKPFSS